MRKYKMVIVSTPVIGNIVLMVFRAKVALSYFVKPVLNLVKWLLKSKEIANFTYDLEENNKRYLASLIADIMNIEFDVAIAYINEIEEDRALREHISDAIARSDMSFVADKEVWFGRRIGWYVFARALKPKVIVETGVDKALGHVY